MKQAAIGIDIGGTNTVMGLVDKEGKVIDQKSIPTDTHPDYKIYMNALCDAVKTLIQANDKDIQIMGIGVGAPNGNYYNGTIEFAPNLNFKGVVPVVEYIKGKFSFPHIILTNDANAAAIGEMMKTLPTNVLIWLIVGGITYTLGAVIYITKKMDFIPSVFGFHEVWHIFVILAAVAHYISILSYIAI